ncbi:hypothetical protein [Vibrio ishigakensis]|uniref:hypothetical protein n=1 Tax=Vibrio ishigakensis TaxID=1481914 RepID=UPI0021C37296|nr:hypothetical protein [Vibrio ishigakensis]
MRKFLALVVACSALASISSHASAGTLNNSSLRSYSNHSDYRVGLGFDQGLGISAELFEQVDAFIGNDGVSADYLVLNDKKFTPSIPFSYFVGVGGFYEFDKTWHGEHGYGRQRCDRDINGAVNCYYDHHYYYGDQDDYFNEYGLRVPLGLDWKFAPQWDTYASLAPKVVIPNNFHFGIDAALGVRYAFE